MQAANQFLIWAFSMSSFWVGYLMAENIQEELAPGRKWFTISEYAIFASAFLPAFMGEMWITLPLLLGFFTRNVYARYTVLFFLLAATMSIDYLYLPTAGLIFTYGIPAGALLFIQHQE